MQLRPLPALHRIGSHRGRVWIALLLLATLVLAGCSSAASAPEQPEPSPPAPTAVEPSATPEPTATSVAEGAAEAAHRLVILHTNDVMGETDPCG